MGCQHASTGLHNAMLVVGRRLATKIDRSIRCPQELQTSRKGSWRHAAGAEGTGTMWTATEMEWTEAKVHVRMSERQSAQITATNVIVTSGYSLKSQRHSRCRRPRFVLVMCTPGLKLLSHLSTAVAGRAKPSPRFIPPELGLTSGQVVGAVEP